MKETVANGCRWIKKYFTIPRSFFVCLFLLLAIWAITLQHCNLVIGNSALALWFTTALINVAPELAGIVIGVVTIDALNEWRQDKELKEFLILDLGGRSNDFAVRAARHLRRRGWLFDVSLRAADLGWAELLGVDLSRADMANANLEKANLAYANLAGARFQGANFNNANLKCANLACANLERALVTSQQLDLAWCLTGAVMPDGTKLRDSGEEITGVDWDREINLTGPTFEEWAALQEIVTSDGEEE